MTVSRRHFVKTAGAVALGFSGLHRFLGNWDAGLAFAADKFAGYGELLPDPEGLINLPQGFSYRIISRIGEEMDDGFLVPGAHDGMAAFLGPQGKTIVVRNHEISMTADAKMGPFGENHARFSQIDVQKVYDVGVNGNPGTGGTTTLVYDTQAQKLERHFLSLVGTLRNCAGGPTPWGSWVTCEETVMRAGDQAVQDHGYCFEVPARAKIGLANPLPLKAMGRLNHEAIAVDPVSGMVYETEDRGDGLIYRFIPKTPGELAQGGILQALMVADQAQLDTRNWDANLVVPGQNLSVAWVTLENVDSPGDDLRQQGFGKGAARFARGEGMWYGNGAIYFACTNGGKEKKGQIWKYTPSPLEGAAGEQKKPGMLSLFAEPNDGKLVENADNLTVSPWGDVIVCEDGNEEDRVIGITPDGHCYTLALNVKNGSELAGVTFSPDGSTMFVNVQALGYTLAITGPWHKA